MYRRIAVLLLASAFVTIVHSEDVLKCYMCTSLSDEGCSSNLTTNSLQPVKCTDNKIMEWQISIQQHNVLSKVALLFKDNEILQYHQGVPQDMACAKMIFNIAKQDVIIRTCQTVKSELIDPCKSMEKKLKNNLLGKMEQCTLCFKNACNSTMFLSPEIFYIFLSFLGILIHIAFYNSSLDQSTFIFWHG